MKATRTDVAKLAGVSTATVSNVLNDPDKVKDETIERVTAAIRQLNYRPNMIARSLSTRRTMQIGIVLEDIRNPYYGEIVEHFEDAAREKGYFVNICTGIKNLDHYFDNFITRGLDGAFVAALPYKFDMDRLYNLVEHDIRVTISGNTNAELRRVSMIENDYITAMREAMRYLADLGHKNIAYLSGLGKELSYDVRCRAYLDCVAELGLPCEDSLLISGQKPYHTDVREGYRQAIRLLDSGKRFTAAICGNDLMAIGAMRAFAERGLSVPRDVSVMGFDGIDIGRYLSVPLTTMAVDKKEFGEKAFELLYHNIVNNITGFYLNRLIFTEGKSTARPNRR